MQDADEFAACTGSDLAVRRPHKQGAEWRASLYGRIEPLEGGAAIAHSRVHVDAAGHPSWDPVIPLPI